MTPPNPDTTNGLLDWAESLICNAVPLAHCTQAEWDEAVKKWRDAKHGVAGENPPLVTNPELENRFSYHPPKPGQPEKYEAIRAKAKEFAYLLTELCPNSRALSTALTQLDSSVFFANAAIARS